MTHTYKADNFELKMKNITTIALSLLNVITKRGLNKIKPANSS